MKIVVSPNFSTPHPFVDIIHAVADRYMDKMLHKSIIAGKLATLEVLLNPRVPTEEDHAALKKRKDTIISMGNAVPRMIYESVMKETVFDTIESSGYHQVIFENDQVFNRIELNIVPDEHPRKFADLVAHEMTHMLVNECFHYSNIADSLVWGTASRGSSVFRWDPEREVEFGRYVEEMIVHTVAEWLVKDMDLPTGDYESPRDYYPEFSWIAMCNLMADAFGTPLKELRYLDAFSVTEDSVEIPNVFWYAFAVNRFGCIIHMFNEVMGENAYEQLCGYIDARESETDEQAREMLQEFVRKYHSKDGDGDKTQ